MRSTVPFPASGTVITDAGLETWLVFDRGIDLPAFAAYPLAGEAEGRRLLEEYYECYVNIARTAGAAVVLEAATWRANPDWAATLGHDRAMLARLIADAVDVVVEVRLRAQHREAVLVGGTVGPRGDGYRVGATMTADEAEDYHGFQIACMADAGVDVVSAVTMGYPEEAIGIARAAASVGLPVVLSFTVETDGRLPNGMTLGEAIAAVDAATGGGPLHYMINCAHPTHFEGALEPGSEWVRRIGGIRANASTLSHAELDEMVELDDGDPADLAERYVALGEKLPAMRVLGGCCGTDHRHVAAIAERWMSVRR